mgnify:CR=1 FL=1
MNKQVVYIISLPRSGSTLLQKLLTTSSSVSSVAEPWFMLPLLSLFHRDYRAPYNSRMTYEAIEAFSSSLDQQGVHLQQEVGEFANRIYSAACGEDSTFFVDKTPRYYYQLNNLQQVMPDAKYIYLFRNPLEVLASKIRMRGHTLKGFAIYEDDIFLAPLKMLNGLQNAPHHFHAVSFHSLVTRPAEAAQRLGDFLGVADITPLAVAQVNIEGKMGDPKAMAEHHNIHSNHESWTSEVNSLVRYFLFRRVLRAIPEEFFEYCETNKTKHTNMLRSSISIRLLHPIRIGSDLLHLAYSRVNTALKRVRT